MKKKLISSFMTILLLFMIGGGVFAQMTTVPAAPAAPASPSGFLTSPQSTATQNRFRSTADDFIRSDTYSGLRFDNFFACTSFANDSQLTLGFATKFNNLYLAAYYGGNFWSGRMAFNGTERSQSFNTDANPSGVKTFTDYYFPALNNGITPNNRFAILLGVADMGIRLSYAGRHQSFSGDDVSSGVTLYKNYSTGYGVISPQIEWAMAKDLTPQNGIRPKVTINLNIVDDYLRNENYNRADGTTNGEFITRSNNYFNPNILAGLGGYHLYNQNNFRLTADFDYELELRSYDNEYSWFDPSDRKYKTKSISGFYNSIYGATEYSWIRNRITPSIAAQYGIGDVNFRLKFNLPLQFTNASFTQMHINTDTGSLEKVGADGTSSAFYFGPTLALAMQWRIIPNRLTLNAGAGITLATLTSTTAEGDTYGVGTSIDPNIKDPDSGTTISTDFYGNTSNNLSLGVTFMPTGNINIEAAMGIGGNTIDVFNGTFVFSNILVSFRY